MKPIHLQKPHRLQAGDRIAAISLSWGGPGAFPGRYEAGKRQLKQMLGLQVVETRHTLKSPGWLYRNPQARCDDLHEAFSDSSIQGVFSTIGGDDSIRLLPYLDLDLLASHPKVFIGFSDTTVTHLALHAARVTSFYGPAIMTSFAENGGIYPYTLKSLRRTLFTPEPIGIIPPNQDGWTDERLEWANPRNQLRQRQPHLPWRWLQGQGIAQGRLLGGNIEALDWLRGTPVWPSDEDWQSAVLFLETSEDAPSPPAVAQMLRCLAAVGVLEKVSAVLFGRPGGQVPVQDFDRYDTAILEVIHTELGLTEIPVITCLDFGHTEPFFTLPYGALAQVDCQRREMTILENAVT